MTRLEMLEKMKEGIIPMGAFLNREKCQSTTCEKCNLRGICDSLFALDCDIDTEIAEERKKHATLL